MNPCWVFFAVIRKVGSQENVQNSKLQDHQMVPQVGLETPDEYDRSIAAKGGICQVCCHILPSQLFDGHLHLGPGIHSDLQ